MAYNRGGYNPDALPQHAEPEQAAQAMNPRRDGSGSSSYRPPPSSNTSSRPDDRYGRAPSGQPPSSYNRPPDPRYANGPRYDQGPPPPRNNYASPPPPANYGQGPPPQDHHNRPPIPHGQRPPTVAPPRDGNDREALWPLFLQVDKDRSGQLSEEELRRALVNGDYTAFDVHTVKMMIRMFDTDRSGTINFDEFCGLWGFLSAWRGLFDRFDVDRSGSISLREFEDALVAFGYRLSPQFTALLFNTYAKNVRGRGDDTGREKGLSFDLFVQACISLKRMTDVFKRFDEDRDGYITLSFEEFLTESLLPWSQATVGYDSMCFTVAHFHACGHFEVQHERCHDMVDLLDVPITSCEHIEDFSQTHDTLCGGNGLECTQGVVGAGIQDSIEDVIKLQYRSDLQITHLERLAQNLYDLADIPSMPQFNHPAHRNLEIAFNVAYKYKATADWLLACLVEARKASAASFGNIRLAYPTTHLGNTFDGATSPIHDASSPFPHDTVSGAASTSLTQAASMPTRHLTTSDIPVTPIRGTAEPTVHDYAVEFALQTTSEDRSKRIREWINKEVQLLRDEGYAASGYAIDPNTPVKAKRVMSREKKTGKSTVVSDTPTPKSRRAKRVKYVEPVEDTQMDIDSSAPDAAIPEIKSLLVKLQVAKKLALSPASPVAKTEDQCNTDESVFNSTIDSTLMALHRAPAVPGMGNLPFSSSPLAQPAIHFPSHATSDLPGFRPARYDSSLDTSQLYQPGYSNYNAAASSIYNMQQQPMTQLDTVPRSMLCAMSQTHKRPADMDLSTQGFFNKRFCSGTSY